MTSSAGMRRNGTKQAVERKEKKGKERKGKGLEGKERKGKGKGKGVDVLTSHY